MTNTKTHLIADESLGGLLREYTETDREASVGDYVHVIYYNGLAEDSIGVVISIDDEGNPDVSVDNRVFYIEQWDDYTTLEPTEVVMIAEETVLDDTRFTQTTATQRTRYKLADRIAKVGEKVVIVAAEGTFDMYDNGDVIKVESVTHGGIQNQSVASSGHVGRGRNSYGYISDKEYRVLIPIESNEAQVEVTEAEASPSVIEMLANLSRRIVSLESQAEDNLETLESQALRMKRLEDEIDTLHRNNVKLAEELANHKAEAKASQATTEVDAVDFSAFTNAVAAKVLDKMTKGLRNA
ncbi:hypothetical protein GJU41_11920 [Bacillus idriensis]|uniref:Uncharacterized protein n=1 Tax=Metabacillus idriensis TaxID=324768 RepID=A0A6I2M922_9BACI|nr:hypothetical protein [Metabacillus idriensis]MRX54680.1 hypothetical protein [Metabacillus idriensis]